MWTIFLYKYLFVKLRILKDEIERIRANSPDKMQGHPLVRLYVSLVEVMGQIKEDPTQEKYLLGNSLGPKHRDWRRAKKGLPARYRLFFKFFSATKELFFVWLNDETTLRKSGAKTDCYAVFRRMLERGDIGSSREALSAASIKERKE